MTTIQIDDLGDMVPPALSLDGERNKAWAAFKDVQRKLAEEQVRSRYWYERALAAEAASGDDAEPYDPVSKYDLVTWNSNVWHVRVRGALICTSKRSVGSAPIAAAKLSARETGEMRICVRCVESLQALLQPFLKEMDLTVPSGTARFYFRSLPDVLAFARIHQAGSMPE